MITNVNIFFVLEVVFELHDYTQIAEVEQDLFSFNCCIIHEGWKIMG